MKEKTTLPIEWTELEYKHSPKDSNWFWFVLSGALILIIIAILMHNFLLGIFAVVAAFTTMILGTKKPGRLTFSVGTKGIKIARHLYPYKELESFWIIYEPPDKKELIIKSKKKLIGHIKIPLGEINPNSVRAVLSKILKEEEYEESLMETIAEKLGF